jgi:hypothetical protein
MDMATGVYIGFIMFIPRGDHIGVIRDKARGSQ